MSELKFRNKKVFYQEAGEGPVLFLLHGFGENGKVWNRQLAVLKEKAHVIIPDLPGSGLSEMLDGEITLEDYADVLIAIADTACPGKLINLFGHSMGGYITMAFVEKYIPRLQSIGLIHSSSFADTEEKKEVRRKSIKFIRENGAEAFMKTTVPNMFSDENRTRHPELVNELSSLAATISDAALIQYYEAMIQRPDRSNLLREISLPVLFTIGKHDNAIPFEISMKQCHLPSISSVSILENAGHMGMWEDTIKTNNSFSTFLENFGK